MAISGEWLEELKEEFSQPYYKKLYEFVQKEYREKACFPPPDRLFRALELTPPSAVKVVILGQDPYHNDGQANGLCFSVNDGVKIPPSLANIYREIEEETGCRMPESGNLEGWARQGVLLLNTVLTVRAHEPNSHRGRGWEYFTDAILDVVNRQNRPVVYMLWGNPAQTKAPLITNGRHLILRAPHPSPLSAYRGFFGCEHFNECNEFLEKFGEKPIDWARTA